jgi:hypothetical protein
VSVYLFVFCINITHTHIFERLFWVLREYLHKTCQQCFTGILKHGIRKDEGEIFNIEEKRIMNADNNGNKFESLALIFFLFFMLLLITMCCVCVYMYIK